VYALTFERPATLAEAAQLAASGAKVLAGGQTLLASMKQRLAQPEQLADLAGIPELSGIRREGDALVIGAMTRHMDVASSAEVRAAIPALADLAAHIGDRQVRAMGTLGGSVANNDPAACYPSAVLALGATVHTTRRKIASEDFFQGMFTTALNEGELITAISFPVAKGAAYMKFVQPASRFALVGVFVAQTSSGVRVAIAGAGFRPWKQWAIKLSADWLPPSF
jgi:carbon-monoxide dehydrogenase medium subunit